MRAKAMNRLKSGYREWRAAGVRSEKEIKNAANDC